MLLMCIVPIVRPCMVILNVSVSLDFAALCLK